MPLVLAVQTAYVAKLAATDGVKASDRRYTGDKDIVTSLAAVVAGEAVVLGTMQASTSLGGDPVPVDKGKETVWLGRWALADGAPLGAMRIAQSSSGDARPVAGGSTPDAAALWYLSHEELRVLSPATGANAIEAKTYAQGGVYDEAHRRWYATTQGTITCNQME